MSYYVLSIFAFGVGFFFNLKLQGIDIAFPLYYVSFIFFLLGRDEIKKEYRSLTKDEKIEYLESQIQRALKNEDYLLISELTKKLNKLKNGKR